MMQLQCPWCGPRPESEFRTGGPAGIARPPLNCDDDTWAGYLFWRRNPKGEQEELWQHLFGCGDWFVLRRDTLTHQFSVAGDVGPSGVVEGGAE
jgi:sarcosine oxidase subunit delta